jgi:hypothetical protein
VILALIIHHSKPTNKSRHCDQESRTGRTDNGDMEGLRTSAATHSNTVTQSTCSEVHPLHVLRHLQAREPHVARAADPQLAVAVQSPAGDLLPAVHEGAVVGASGYDGGGDVVGVPGCRWKEGGESESADGAGRQGKRVPRRCAAGDCRTESKDRALSAVCKLEGRPHWHQLRICRHSAAGEGFQIRSGKR